MALTFQQTKLVRGTIPALIEHGEHITATFYRNMLKEHPELNNYFNVINQANGRQPRALTAIILRFADNINHITELIPKMERMCQKHCSLGIKPGHYEIVGKYLIDAFGQVLGPAMTPEVREAWEKAYWILAKMLIGREAQLYRDFETWKGWRRFRIQQRMEESDDIFSFYLVPEDGQKLPSFMPGQYVSLRVPVPEKGYMQSRQYSLSERSRPDYYRITIKRDRGTRKGRQRSTTRSPSKLGYLPGIVSNMLIDHKPVGDIVELTHPAGEFFLDINDRSNSPLVLISAGVGVTPLISILNTVTESQPERPISWIQGARSSVPFYLHVRRVARERHNLHVSIFKTDLADFDLAGGVTTTTTTTHDDHDGGDYCMMDLVKIQAEDLWLRHATAEYFICGPELFMVGMAKNLGERGVDSSRIKLELFSTGDTEFQLQDIKSTLGRGGRRTN